MNRFTRTLRLASIAAAMALSSGCLATYSGVEDQAAQQAELELIRERLRRVEGRMEGVDLELQRLAHLVDQLRASPTGPSRAEVESLQVKLAALDGQLRAVDAARQKDRQDIIDSLSGKIASLVSRAPAPRAPATAPKRSASQEGYEHIVAAGESLSAIAAAYKVRASDIVEANGLARPDQLRVGQKLFIPAP